MKPKLTFLLALLAGCGSIAFSQTNPLANYLPANTNMVIHINPVRLVAKLGPEAFKQSVLYQELMKKPESPIHAIITDPASSGIDLGTGLLVFTAAVPEETGFKSRVNLIGRISNREAFEALITKFVPAEKILTYGTDKLVFNDATGAFAWNKNVFVLTSGSGNYSEFDFPVNDTDVVNMEKWMTRLKEKNIKAIRELCFDLLTPKPQNGFAGNERFNAYLQAPADIKTWTSGNGESMGKMLFPFGNLLSELQAYTASIKTSFINFEDGKIVVESRNYLQGEIADLYKKYTPGPINLDLLKRLPKGKLLGMMHTSYNSGIANEMLQKPVFSKLLDSLATVVPFNFRELPGIFKSEMMMAVVQTDENNSKEGIQFILAMPIADHQKFKEMGVVFLRFYDSLKNKQFPGQYIKEFNPVVKNDESLFVLSLSAASAAAFLNAPGTQPLPEWIGSYAQHPLVMQVNMREIIKMALAKKGEKKNNGLNEEIIMNMFNEIIVYGGSYQEESLNTTMEFRFSDPSKNSLKQLFELINKVAETNKETIQRESRGSDSTTQESELKIVEIRQEEAKQPPPPPPPPPKTTPPKVEMKKFTPPVKKKD